MKGSYNRSRRSNLNPALSSVNHRSTYVVRPINPDKLHNIRIIDVFYIRVFSLGFSRYKYQSCILYIYMAAFESRAKKRATVVGQSNYVSGYFFATDPSCVRVFFVTSSNCVRKRFTTGFHRLTRMLYTTYIVNLI